MSSTHNHCFSHHHYQAWCHQIFFVNNTKIFVTPSVLKLQKWFLHQNGVEFNQKSKSDDSGPLYKVTWQCLAVPELPKDLLKMAQDGFITFSLGLLGIYEYLLFKIHYLNTSLRKLGRAAECLKTEDHKGKMKVRLRSLLWDIEDLEPISGYGLFNVDRTTLTSTVSVMVTYLIILIQFKQAALNT